MTRSKQTLFGQKVILPRQNPFKPMLQRDLFPLRDIDPRALNELADGLQSVGRVLDRLIDPLPLLRQVFENARLDFSFAQGFGAIGADAIDEAAEDDRFFGCGLQPETEFGELEGDVDVGAEAIGHWSGSGWEAQDWLTVLLMFDDAAASIGLVYACLVGPSLQKCFIVNFVLDSITTMSPSVNRVSSGYTLL